jgi:glycosyltransferase involved in cell wall biosynthesis
MKKVLVIAYYFPPAGGGGVQRTVKFVKYLSRFGWQPFVLTAGSTSYATKDKDLLKDVPEEATIFRINSLITRKRSNTFRQKSLLDTSTSARGGERHVKGLKNRLFWTFRDVLLIPDAHLEWVPFALFAGLKVINRHNIDAIYTTGGPFSTFLAGYILHKMTRTPWVADFRDAWMQCSYRMWESRFRRDVEQHLEHTVVKSADRVIVVSQPMREYFLKTYPEVSPSKFEIIPNGFDPDDFRGLDFEKPEKFTICYTGRIGLEMYSPESFLRALSLLIEEREEVRDNIQVVFSGLFEDRCRAFISQLGLENVIRIDGYLPHREAVRRQKMAHLLLLICTADQGGEEILTGKLLEYLNHGTTILALISRQTEAARLIRQTRSGSVIEPQKVNMIKQALWIYYQQYKERNVLVKSIPDSILQRYNRIHLTNQLAGQLDNIV